MALYSCNACGWSCPADEIGAVLMESHLADCPGPPADVEHAAVLGYN